MRWDELFGDLDAQLHAAEQMNLEQEVTELARIEASQLTLADALRASLQTPITVILANENALKGTLLRVGTGWLLLSHGLEQTIVPFLAISRLSGVGTSRELPGTGISYTVNSALRLLSRYRAPVLVTLKTGNQSIFRGVIDQVGADFLVLAQLADGVGRRGDNRQANVYIPLAELQSVTSSRENEF